MTSITGANTRIGVRLISTFGTANTCVAGDKMEVESLNFNENVSELAANPIGSGNDMANESQRGATSPSATVELIDMYEGSPALLEALWFGTSAAPMDMTDSAYSHSWIYNETRNQAFATMVVEGTAAAVFEMPSGTPAKVTVNLADPPNYVMKTVDILGDSWDTTGTVNETEDLASLTLEDTNRIVVKNTDSFQLNAQADGALSASDDVDIISAVLEYDHPVEHVREIAGSATYGNSEPRSAGSPPLSVTVTITFRKIGRAHV